MSPKTILFLGPDSGTSGHRVRALERLGHDVTVLDPQQFLPVSGSLQRWLAEKWLWQVGSDLFQRQIAKAVLRAVGTSSFNMALVDGGRLVGPDLVRELKRSCGSVVNYNIDDPFGKRDRNNWKLYLRTVPFYDLVVVLRECNVVEAAKRGAQRVLRVPMSADEVAHAPRALTEADRRQWFSQVVFVGTWMPERGPFLSRLVQLGVPLSIFGDRWQKAPEWRTLQPVWRGPALSRDDDYAKAILCSRVALGLLSKGNRDQSTTRTFEIPHLGGVFCGERTPEHSSLYREDEEAVFWRTPEECAEACATLLRDPALRQRLASLGRKRCVANGTVNEKVMDRIVSAAFSDYQTPHHAAAALCAASTGAR